MSQVKVTLLIGCLVILAACGAKKEKSDESNNPVESYLPTALTVQSSVTQFTLETTTLRISGECEAHFGAVSVSHGTHSLSIPCLENRWSRDFSHSDFTGPDYVIILTAAQRSQQVTVTINHETIGYVCANSNSTEIAARNLTAGCNAIAVSAIQEESGLQTSELVELGCTVNCPTYDSATEAVTFAAGNSPTIIPSSPEVSADEALTVFAAFNWTGSGMNLSGQPAAMLLEKGQNDDDNYGIYFFGNQFCFEYNTIDVEYRSHCVTTIAMNTNMSIAVVFSFADQTIKMYVDGVLRGTFAQAKRLRNNNYPVYVGQQNYPGNAFAFYGQIKGLTILSRSLADGEISLLHSGVSF